MAWTPRTSRNGIEYGGSASRYYWDPSVNPNANYNNCLANCTTLAYGRPLENGNPAPVSSIHDAGKWHNYVANGWRAVPYSTGHSSIKPGDIIEWPGHVAVVETVVGGVAYCSSSLYTGDHGRAYWPPDSDNYDTRSASEMGSTLQSVSDWMISNYAWRFYEFVSETTITNTRLGVSPTYILVNPDTTPGPGPGPEPGETLAISIYPESYNVTMGMSENYVDMTFNITITGIPNGQTVSGGNSYPGLSRVYNSGWSYTDYTVDGITYRMANKTQTLRYEREGLGSYDTVKHMYYDLDMSTGSIHTDTPMYIHVLISIILVSAINITNNEQKGGHVTIYE